MTTATMNVTNVTNVVIHAAADADSMNTAAMMTEDIGTTGTTTDTTTGAMTGATTDTTTGIMTGTTTGTTTDTTTGTTTDTTTGITTGTTTGITTGTMNAGKEDLTSAEREASMTAMKEDSTLSGTMVTARKTALMEFPSPHMSRHIASRRTFLSQSVSHRRQSSRHRYTTSRLLSR